MPGAAYIHSCVKLFPVFFRVQEKFWRRCVDQVHFYIFMVNSKSNNKMCNNDKYIKGNVQDDDYLFSGATIATTCFINFMVVK